MINRQTRDDSPHPILTHLSLHLWCMIIDLHQRDQQWGSTFMKFNLVLSIDNYFEGKAKIKI